MNAQLLKLWDRLRSSFWFLPSLMTAGAVALAFATVGLDNAVTKEWLQGQSWAYTGGAEGASSVLRTIAGSMMTIAGVVFSMTLVALSLASSQFGPRLLRNFMRDTVNQFVIGTFVSTFLYCLIVLRTIRHVDENAFVPHLSVTFGLLFALFSIGVFIYFIHHVSVSIQAGEIVARVGRELVQEVEKLFPEEIGHDVTLPVNDSLSPRFPESFDREARPVGALGDGYLQLIDSDALMALAQNEDLLIQVVRRPGQFLVKGSPLVRVWPEQRVTDQVKSRIGSIFVLGKQQTPGQDIEFAVRQLVEIAVRSLSPSVNDPFTAIACVDRLGSALCRLAQREIPSPYRFDEDQRLRVIAPVVTFPDIIDAACNQIRQYGRTSVAVTIRLLEALAAIAKGVSRPADRASILRHTEMIVRGARENLPEEEDRQAVEVRYQEVLEALLTPN